MKISINCPSYKRPKVETLDYLPFCKVWVDNKEYEEYVKKNKGFEKNIVSCPDGIQGNLCRIRNYILDKEFENGADVVLIIDDDMKGIYHFEGNKEYCYNKILVEKDEFIDFIEKYSIMCDELGFKFWGLNCNQDALSYRQYSPFSTVSYIGGPFQCFLKNDLRYDERLPLKEDYDMTLQQCNKYRGCLRLNKFFYNCKQSKQAGGCATYRNYDKEIEQLELLCKKWGKEIVKIDKTKNSNQKKESKKIDYNPIIKIPINRNIKRGDIMAKGQIKQKQSTINKSQFEGMCFVQCTKEEICAILGVSDITLTRWCKNTYNDNFEGVYKKYSEGGKMSLRRTQFRLAEKNASMAIFLGKQYLGQKDNIEVESTQLVKVEELLNKIENEANK